MKSKEKIQKLAEEIVCAHEAQLQEVEEKLLNLKTRNCERITSNEAVEILQLPLMPRTSH